MGRKLYCKNSGCKHYERNEVCGVVVKLDEKGRCTSFKKGFAYYFHLVWNAMGESNMIDFFRIEHNPDLRIGIYYVCKVYHLYFTHHEYGMWRYLTFGHEEKKGYLVCDEIISMEWDQIEFESLLNDFNNGILPQAENPEETKSQYESQSYGWLSPGGEFIPSDFGTHEQSADSIIEKKGFQKDYKKKQELNSSFLCRDYLIEFGYCLIHDPTGQGLYLVSHTRPLTKKQNDFLHEYFMKMGDSFKADQFHEVKNN